MIHRVGQPTAILKTHQGHDEPERYPTFLDFARRRRLQGLGYGFRFGIPTQTEDRHCIQYCFRAREHRSWAPARETKNLWRMVEWPIAVSNVPTPTAASLLCFCAGQVVAPITLASSLHTSLACGQDAICGPWLAADSVYYVRYMYARCYDVQLACDLVSLAEQEHYSCSSHAPVWQEE